MAAAAKRLMSSDVGGLQDFVVNEVQTTASNLSTDLRNGFSFGYNISSNVISAAVAGKTMSFSADRFTEARML